MYRYVEREMPSSKVVARPGGRTARTTKRIFDATLDLLTEEGFDACTFQTIAARAQVGRATLYRRWKDRSALVADALADHLDGAIKPRDTGALASDLRALMEATAAFLQSPMGRAAMMASAGQQADDRVARAALWDQRRSAVAPIFRRAIDRGELSTDVDEDVFLASAMGAIYFRLLVMAKPVDGAWLDRILAQGLAVIR